jgi:hypothetical protein
MPNRTLVQLGAAAAAGAAIFLVSCASTTLQSTWMDPSFTGGPFKKVFVIGLAPNQTSRRVFEDIMVARLQAAGVQAVPAYQFISEDAMVPEPILEAAVQKSGADSMLMTRLLGVRTEVNAQTVMVPGPMVGPGFGPGWGGPGWWGAYNSWWAVPQISTYQIATAETTLFDASTRRIVWTATSQTFNPQSVQREAPGLADQVIAAMRARNLLPAAN